mgnify:CR=1 FL=1
MRKNPETKYIGEEPKLVKLDGDNYVSELAQAMNWFNRECDKRDARGYIRNYIIATQGRGPLKIFDRIPDSFMVTTFGWMGRLWVHGTRFKDADQKKLDDFVANLLTYRSPASTKPEVVRPNIRDNMEEKISEYLGELEGSLDYVINTQEAFDLHYDLKAREVPMQYCSRIGDWIKSKSDEFNSIQTTTDLQIVEGYSNFTKRKLNFVLKCLDQWAEDLVRYSQHKKANRKPRAKKQKPASQQVSKLKYLKEFTELSLKSISAVDIVGASQVWVYNTKTKKLAAYRTDSALGIQVKGTTLQNYDPEVSEQRTLRNPEKTLKLLLGAGKIQLRKVLSDLSTKAGPVNGRINEECILVRAIK